MTIADMTTEPFDFELDLDRLRTEDLILWQADELFSSGLVREDSLLPSWPGPNWMVADNRVRQIRSRASERETRRQFIMATNGAMDPFSLMQNPPISILSLGEWQWVDYELHATFAGGRDGPTGVAFRYQDARHYYALTIQTDVGMRIVLRSGDEHRVLAHVPLGSPQQEYDVIIRVQNDELQAGLRQGPIMRVIDGAYAYGKGALVCEG